MKIKTIFRTFHTGDTIALFPEIPADVRGHHCLSYQTIGQHGAASPDLSHCTRPATPDEIAPLAAELARIGYTIAPVRRVSCAMHQARRAALAVTVSPVTLTGDPGHAEAQAETVRRLTTRPAWKLADCTRPA